MHPQKIIWFHCVICNTAAELCTFFSEIFRVAVIAQEISSIEKLTVFFPVLMRVIKLTTKEPATTFLVRAVEIRGLGGWRSNPHHILTNIESKSLPSKGLEVIPAPRFLQLPTALFLNSLNYYAKFKSQKTSCSVLFFQKCSSKLDL